MRRSPIAALAAVAYAVILVDLLTKVFAVALIGAEPVGLVEGVRLALVYNDGGAFGLPAREFGIELSTAVTFGLILVMLRVCRELAVVDAKAPLMLGLISGAGAANHIDMLASPRGVADFIALEIGALEGIVFNVADVALVVGLLLCARTAGLLILRIVEERPPALALAGVPGWAASRNRRRADRAERIRGTPVFREPEAALALGSALERGGGASQAPESSANGSVATAGAAQEAASPERAAPVSGLAALLSLPSRFDRAATPALVIACTFILVYSLAIVWLPDAGRSAPNALLLALVVFGSVFVAVYAEMLLAERREARVAREAGVRAYAETGLHPALAGGSGDIDPAALERAERTIFDGSLPGADAGEAATIEPEPVDRQRVDERRDRRPGEHA